jgi:hypothetical protein
VHRFLLDRHNSLDWCILTTTDRDALCKVIDKPSSVGAA